MNITIKLSNSKIPIKRGGELYKLITKKFTSKFPNSFVRDYRLWLSLEHRELTFYNFDEFEKEFRIEDLDGRLIIYGLEISISPDKDNYESVIFKVHGNILDVVDISIVDMHSNLSRKVAEEFINDIQTLYPECKVQKFNPDQDEEDHKMRIANDIVEILSNVTDLQRRLPTPLNNEKDFQNFLFPILKSHYASLKDEESLPQFAGSQTIPDFSIPEGKLLIEAKFARKVADFKNFRKEISDDLNTYLINSEYENVVVIIYNSNNLALPNDYVKDLEEIDGIYKVIISPGIKVESNL